MVWSQSVLAVVAAAAIGVCCADDSSGSSEASTSRRSFRPSARDVNSRSSFSPVPRGGRSYQRSSASILSSHALSFPFAFSSSSSLRSPSSSRSFSSPSSFPSTSFSPSFPSSSFSSSSPSVVPAFGTRLSTTVNGISSSPSYQSGRSSILSDDSSQSSIESRFTHQNGQKFPSSSGFLSSPTNGFVSSHTNGGDSSEFSSDFVSSYTNSGASPVRDNVSPLSQSYGPPPARSNNRFRPASRNPFSLSSISASSNENNQILSAPLRGSSVGSGIHGSRGFSDSSEGFFNPSIGPFESSPETRGNFNNFDSSFHSFPSPNGHSNSNENYASSGSLSPSQQSNRFISSFERFPQSDTLRLPSQEYSPPTSSYSSSSQPQQTRINVPSSFDDSDETFPSNVFPRAQQQSGHALASHSAATSAQDVSQRDPSLVVGPYPNYYFSYDVNGATDRSGSSNSQEYNKKPRFGHSERRNDYRTEGRYYVELPDGRVQVVEYYADKTGYHPTVTYL